MTTVLLVVAVAVGYLAGRARPARWLGETLLDWASNLHRAHPRLTRRSWRWWARETIYAPLALWLLTTQPRRTIHAWRTRHDPPPRSPAPRLVHPWPPEQETGR